MQDALQQAEQLLQEEKWHDAVQLLSVLNKEHEDVAVERKLVDTRIQAHRSMQWPEPAGEWAGEWDFPMAETPSIMEFASSDFSARTLAEGILGHGAMIVRGLVSPEVTAALKECIDNTIQAREADEVEDSPWDYESPHITGKPKKFGSKDEEKRAKVKKGSIWVAESPRTMQKLIELYKALGLKEVLTDYFAEPPALSVRKWVLRRILPDANPADWHQDGRFMGTDFRSVNMWLPLVECGGGANAAGMEIIPSQRREIHETGTRGAAFQWSVGRELVEDLARELPVAHPHFNPGDALFFDHYNLHRTAFRPGLTESRYAVESWFFSSSSVPAKQMPIFF